MFSLQWIKSIIKYVLTFPFCDNLNMIGMLGLTNLDMESGKKKKKNNLENLGATAKWFFKIKNFLALLHLFLLIVHILLCHFMPLLKNFQGLSMNLEKNWNSLIWCLSPFESLLQNTTDLMTYKHNMHLFLTVLEVGSHRSKTCKFGVWGGPSFLFIHECLFAMFSHGRG